MLPESPWPARVTIRRALQTIHDAAILYVSPARRPYHNWGFDATARNWMVLRVLRSPVDRGGRPGAAACGVACATRARRGRLARRRGSAESDGSLPLQISVPRGWREHRRRVVDVEPERRLRQVLHPGFRRDRHDSGFLVLPDAAVAPRRRQRVRCGVREPE